ncbi:MotE family protein [Palleronia sediminis]|uniref:MotE family protein n=1 Tax=Palleronia sediminis TaxID=2547833 RepID=UPI001F0E83B7|nr:hypothetical protein [Palleronia sediminis]
MPALAALLMCSALLRATAVAPDLPGFGPAIAGAAIAATPDPAPSDDVDTLLTDLAARADRMTEREAALAERERRLARGEEALRAQLDEIKAAEDDLRALLQMADEAAEADLARLAAVYEAMKPAEAATLFKQMPPAFAAGFLGLMRPELAAAILAAMPPEGAYAVSVMLAGRHADIPPATPAPD